MYIYLFQAWFAGQNMVDHDKYITNIRETDIKDTIDEILDYEYRTREELEKVRSGVRVLMCFSVLPRTAFLSSSSVRCAFLTILSLINFS